MEPSAVWQGRRVRLVTFAWGKSYIDNLLERALSSALAPGNLPTLAEHFDCTVVIVTEESLFTYVKSHPISVKLQLICPLKLVSLDDLIGEPWQYGITLAYALFRGFSDLASEMTESFILFLNADFVLADGCYARLMPHMLAGERALFAPSYCANEEEVTPLLQANAVGHNGAIVLAPRAMADLIIAHRHNTIRTKILNQDVCHFAYSDQFYWQADERTIVGHQMPIALVGVRPEVRVTDINTFWDWGVVHELCPSKKMTVLGDSDEFLMLELRARTAHIESIRCGHGTPKSKASGMSGYITQYQLDHAKFPLTLHGDELPGDIEAARAALDTGTKEILKHVTQAPTHSGHKAWRHHQLHLKYFHETRLRRAAIAEMKENLRLLEEPFLLGRRSLRPRLHELQQLHKNGLDAVSMKSGFLAVPLWRTLSRQARMAAGFILHTRLLPYVLKLTGEVPRYPPWHPSWSEFRHISRLLRETKSGPPLKLLMVCTDEGWLAKSIELPPGSTVFTATESQLNGDGIAPASEGNKFDLCIVQLDSARITALETIYDQAIKHLSPNGKIVFHYMDSTRAAPILPSNIIARVSLKHGARFELYAGGLTRAIRSAGVIIAWLNLHSTIAPLRREVLKALFIILLAPFWLCCSMAESLKSAITKGRDTTTVCGSITVISSKILRQETS